MLQERALLEKTVKCGGGLPADLTELERVVGEVGLAVTFSVVSWSLCSLATGGGVLADIHIGAKTSASQGPMESLENLGLVAKPQH